METRPHLTQSKPIENEKLSNSHKNNFVTGLRNPDQQVEPQAEQPRNYNMSESKGTKSFYTQSSIRSKGRNKLTINDLNNTDYNKNLSVADRIEKGSQKSKTSGNGHFPSIHKNKDIYGGNPYEPKIENLVTRNNGMGMRSASLSKKSYSQRSEPKLDIQTGGFN